jgi:hypothetical protein
MPSPLIVRAKLRSPAVSFPPLDALLGAMVAEERGLVAGFGPVVPIDDLPLERSVCGRFWLASEAIAETELYEPRFVNRRFPIAEFQMLGEGGSRKIDIASGVNRSYRIPTRVMHVDGDTVTWYALGEEGRVRELLGRVTHLGKRRGVGRGGVASWGVETIEPWEGFPVLHEGRPLRALPVDWPGVASDARRAHRVLSPPLWEHRRAELCVVPS